MNVKELNYKSSGKNTDEILGWSVVSLLESSTPQNIYHLIGSTLSMLVPSAIVGLSEIKTLDKSLIIRFLHGFDKYKKIKDFLGYDPLGKSFKLSVDKKYAGMYQGKVVEVPGIHELSLGNLNTGSSKIIEKIIKSKYYYGIGLSWQGELKSIGFFITGVPLQNEIIERIEYFCRVGATAFNKLENYKKVKASEDTLKHFMNNLPIGIYRTTPAGKLLMANDSLLEMLGYNSFDELAKLDNINVFYTEDFPREYFTSRIEKDGELKGLELKWIRKDKKILHVRMNARLVRDQSGNTLYYEGSVENITSVKEAEYNINRYKEKIRLQTRDIPLVFIEWDEKLRVIDWNPAAEKVFGYSREEILLKHGLDFIVPKDMRAKIDDYIIKFLENPEHGSNENENIDKNGRRIKCKWYNTPYFGENGQLAGLYSIAEDVTERRKMEEQLKDAKELAELAFTVSPSAMYTVDLNCKITSWNRRAEELTGFTAAEIMNNHCSFFALNPCGEGCGAFENKDEMFQLGKECMIRRKDGKIRHINKNTALLKNNIGEIIGAIESFEDVTEKLVQEVRNREYQQKLKFLSRTANDFLTREKEEDIYEYITENLYNIIPESVVWVNRYNPGLKQLETKAYAGLKNNLNKVIKLLGVDPLTMKFPISPQEYTLFSSQALHPIDNEEVIYNYPYFTRTTFKLIKKLFNITKIYSAGLYQKDELMGNVSVITRNGQEVEDFGIVEAFIYQASIALHRVLIKKQLIIAKKKAEESDRLKSAFLANMSHEIRTPMNGIIGFSDLLRNNDLPEGKRSRYLDVINDNGRFLLMLINDIIDISKIQSGLIEIKNSKFNLNGLLDEIKIFFQGNLEFKKKNLELKTFFSLPGNASIIYTDKFRLQQVLTNLIGNAIKFTDKGFIEFGYKKINEKWLEFSVKDTGIGLPEEKVNMIFGRFTQVDSSITRKYGGSGLGLAISKGIVELLGGKISVKSSPGKGSLFTFTLPLQEVENKEQLPGEPKQIPVNNIKGKKILIVEDDNTSILFLQELLADEGVQVVKANNGLEAIEIMKTEEDIVLVLMDINMPVMDGVSATREIKKILPHVPVIAQTANAMLHDRGKFLSNGFDNYITKPINKKLLLSLISQYIE